MPCKFQWQAGFGAFSYSRKDLERVIKYILNQPEHHQRKAFREEYLDLLQQYEVKYEEAYLFDFF